MEGYSPKLPIVLDTTDGPYALNKTSLETIKQDFKMLLLTSPGERMMNPDFGVGLKRLLFEQDTAQTRENILQSITTQTQRYLDFITITDINLSGIGQNENSIYVLITYYIPSLNATEQLNLSVSAI